MLHEANENSNVAAIVAEIDVQWRQRQAWHRAEKSLTLQAKALCRGLASGDKAEAEIIYDGALGKREHPLAPVAAAAIMPLVDGREVIKKSRASVEKRLAVLARELPVWPKVKSIRGFDALSLAALVGLAGDLANYPKKGHLWKRLGLGLVGDTIQGRVPQGLSRENRAAAWLARGYSPRRRSTVYTFGSAIVKVGDVYREVFLDRCAYEYAEAVRQGLVPASKDDSVIATWKKRGLKVAKVKKVDPAIHRSAGHMHNRAQRYMEKRLVRDVWQAWKAAA